MLAEIIDRLDGDSNLLIYMTNDEFCQNRNFEIPFQIKKNCFDCVQRHGQKFFGIFARSEVGTGSRTSIVVAAGTEL